MGSIAAFQVRGKKKLHMCIGAAIVCSPYVMYGQTYTWTNAGVGNNNIWITNANWDGNVAPSLTSHTAEISGGTGSTLFFRDGNSGSLSIGTILLRNDLYDKLHAGAPSAIVNFGSASTIDFFPPTEHGSFQMGDATAAVGTATLKTTFSLPGRLDVLTIPKGFFWNPQVIQQQYAHIRLSRLFQTSELYG